MRIHGHHIIKKKEETEEEIECHQLMMKEMNNEHKSYLMDFIRIAQSNILDLLGLSEAPHHVQQRAINQALEIIFDSVANRIKAELSPEALTHYAHAFRENSSEEERSAFLATYVPQFDEIVKEETLRYKYLCETTKHSLAE